MLAFWLLSSAFVLVSGHLPRDFSSAFDICQAVFLLDSATDLLDFFNKRSELDPLIVLSHEPLCQNLLSRFCHESYFNPKKQLIQAILENTDYEMDSKDVNAVMEHVAPIDEHREFIKLLLDRNAPITNKLIADCIVLDLNHPRLTSRVLIPTLEPDWFECLCSLLRTNLGLCLEYLRGCLRLGANPNVLYEIGTPLHQVLSSTNPDDPVARKMIILLLAFGAYPEEDLHLSDIQEISKKVESARVFATITGTDTDLLPEVIMLIIENILC